MDKQEYFRKIQQSQPFICPMDAEHIGYIEIDGKPCETWTSPRGDRLVDWRQHYNPDWIGPYVWLANYNPKTGKWM